MGETSTTKVAVLWLDDVGWDLWENIAAHTPSLDRLAAVGRVYTNAWGAHSCSPARARFLKGTYHTGVGSILRHDDDPPFSMDSAGCFPESLVGERVHLGKWHLAADGHTQHPLDCGFSAWDGSLFNLGHPPGSSYSYWQRCSAGGCFMDANYATTAVGIAAIHQIESLTPFLNVAFHAPHPPYHAPPPNLHSFGDLTNADDDTLRLAMLEVVDMVVGRVAAAALRQGYVVFVSSDNGSAGPDKGSLREGSLRVPLIALGAQVVPGASAQFVDCVDFAATISELGGGSFQSGDSRSFTWDLRGEHPAPDARTWLYCERYTKNGDPSYSNSKGYWQALRFRDGLGDWKVVHYGNDPAKEDEVYDLRTDSAETTNLIATHAHIRDTAVDMMP